LKLNFHYYNHIPMKNFSLLVLLLSFCFLYLNGQVDKKDKLIVVNGKISNIKLSSLNPEDVKSLSISNSPKDKDAYGVLAENGVIYITTKENVKIDNLNDQPSKALVLVDGKVYTNSLDSINIQEVESVSVRKDKSATGPYGKAGGNGVILITTKDKALNKKQ
jgi:TonB-dependent SusC/RagA subfamily outer membrane receptor